MFLEQAHHLGNFRVDGSLVIFQLSKSKARPPKLDPSLQQWSFKLLVHRTLANEVLLLMQL